MAIKASDLRKSAEGDPPALQQSHAPDVRIGGDLVVGNDLAVPAGQTWRVNGNVKIEDGAVIRIENGATLALTGIDADRVAGGGQQRRITVSDAVRYLAGDDGGHQQAQIVLRAPAEPEPGELEWLSAQIKQYALEPKPTDADRQMVERVKAEADRFMLVSPADAERLRAQIDHPFFLSPDEAQRVAAQFTSGIAPVALGGYAAELMRPPETAALMVGLAPSLEYWNRYQASWAEAIRQAIEPISLTVANVAITAHTAALESLQQALNPMAVNMMNAAIEMMSKPSKQMAEIAASWERSFGVGIAQSALSNLNIGRGAFDDFALAQSALRNSGFSMGALDDLNISLGRLHEQRQAPPARRQPEPPVERVQVVHLAPGDWQEALTHALTSGQASPRDVGEFLYSLSVQQRQAGPVPPAWADIEAVAVMYRDNGHRYKNQGRFVDYLASKGMAIGLSTFKEWIRLYEENTGVKLRPGQGSRKRKTIIG